MTPASFCDWLSCFLEDAEIGNKPTVAQWATILKRLDQVDTNKPVDAMGFIGFVEQVDEDE